MQSAVDECAHIFCPMSCGKESGTLLSDMYFGWSKCVNCGRMERFEFGTREELDAYTAPYYAWLRGSPR